MHCPQGLVPVPGYYPRQRPDPGIDLAPVVVRLPHSKQVPEIARVDTESPTVRRQQVDGPEAVEPRAEVIEHWRLDEGWG
jgi:hypothetical protein